MKYLYEFIGTFFLVLTVGMTVLEPNSSPVLAPLAIGAVLAAMIFAGGHISGGHYNPAVSFAIFLRKKISKKDLGLYWVLQFLAGAIAGWLVIYLKGYPAQAPIAFDTLKAFIAEFLFTFALCFVVLNVALAKGTKGNSFYGWAIGITVLAGACAVGAISGGAFNPAVALGIAVMKLVQISNIWIFFLANFLGSALAALVFKAVETERA